MSDVRDWLVTYKSTSRAHVDVWAVVVDVPAELEAADVSTALELWERWPRWQARVRPGATVNVRKRTRADELGGFPGLARLEWSALAPIERRVQVKLPGVVYASCVRAARLEGLSLAAWVTRTLTVAADVDVDELGADAAPLFVDVPLPLEGVDR